MKTAKELGVTIVAYSPLGRGMVSGRYVAILLLWMSTLSQRSYLTHTPDIALAPISKKGISDLCLPDSVKRTSPRT